MWRRWRLRQERSRGRDVRLWVRVWPGFWERGGLRDLQRGGAGEVLRLVYTAASFVPGYLRVGAEWTGTDYFSGADSCGRDLGWRIRFFYPLHQRGHRVKGAGAYASAAMEHSRNHEEAHEIGGGWSHFPLHLLEVFDAHACVQRWIGPAEIHHDFAAALLEGGEVRVCGIEDLADFIEAGRVAVEVESGYVIGGVFLWERDVAPEGLGEAFAKGGIGVGYDPAIPTAAAIVAGDFGADGPAR